MVAGEPSGDLLGSRALRALRQALPGREIHAEGVGGEAMQEEGLDSLYAMDRLAVMGLIEPLGRLPELLAMRRDLRRRWLAQPPDLFLGIDAPDFNLGLARGLRNGGVATAQLVSPTVWAWRAGRVHTVARSVADLLCLFPFEPACYADVDLRTHYVGHPLVREFADVPTRQQARQTLGIGDGPVLALLPGSRAAEVAQHGAVLLDAARLLAERDPRRRFIMPAAGPERHAQLQTLLDASGLGDRVCLVRGQSREAMIAADVVLLASGTATLEAMLLRRPMVIVYRMAALGFRLMQRLAVTRFVGLPNVLAGRALVPELLQDALTAPALALQAETLLGREGAEQVAALQACRGPLERDFDQEVGRCLSSLITGCGTAGDPDPGA